MAFLNFFFIVNRNPDGFEWQYIKKVKMKQELEKFNESVYNDLHDFIINCNHNKEIAATNKSMTEIIL